MNCHELKQRIEIRTVMESFNLQPIRSNGRTGFYLALDREEKVPSLLIDYVKNTAFDFGTGKNYDIISIVQVIKKCSVSEALLYLKKLNFSDSNENLNCETSPVKSYEITKISEVFHPALMQYLKSRRVEEQKHLVKEIHYQIKGKLYFGIGFKNNSGGFEIRNSFSKICLGKKDITLVKDKNSKTKEICVFEGFFDYLTYRNIHKEDKNSDFLILNSTAMLFKAREILHEYHKICLFLDNDSNGISTKESIVKTYKNVEDCSLLYKDFKDLSEWFCKR